MLRRFSGHAAAFSRMLVSSDNHLLLVNKPPGQLCQGDRTGDAPLDVLAAEWLRSQPKPTKYCGMVHRLDRPTSGAMVMARTSKAAARLARAFKNRQVGKQYLVVVESVGAETLPVGGSGWLIDALMAPVDQERRAGRMTVKHLVRRDGGAGGQLPASLLKEAQAKLDQELGCTWALAALRYEVLWAGGASSSTSGMSRGTSLLAVELHTGRRHQIRAQLSALGLCVANDVKYKGNRVAALGEGCTLSCTQRTLMASFERHIHRRVST